MVSKNITDKLKKNTKFLKHQDTCNNNQQISPQSIAKEEVKVILNILKYILIKISNKFFKF